MRKLRLKSLKDLPKVIRPGGETARACTFFSQFQPQDSCHGRAAAKQATILYHRGTNPSFSCASKQRHFSPRQECLTHGGGQQVPTVLTMAPFMPVPAFMGQERPGFTPQPPLPLHSPPHSFRQDSDAWHTLWLKNREQAQVDNANCTVSLQTPAGISPLWQPDAETRARSGRLAYSHGTTT